MVHESLKEVAEHIEKKETAYNYEFKQEPLFGGISWINYPGVSTYF